MTYSAEMTCLIHSEIDMTAPMSARAVSDAELDFCAIHRKASEFSLRRAIQTITELIKFISTADGDLPSRMCYQALRFESLKGDGYACPPDTEH